MKCIFLGYGTDGEFGYRLWEPENRKLIRSNEDSILSQNQQKIVGKKVSFEIATDDVEGPAHRTELTPRQRTKENEVSADPDRENGALSELEDKAIKENSRRKRQSSHNESQKQQMRSDQHTKG